MESREWLERLHFFDLRVFEAGVGDAESAAEAKQLHQKTIRRLMGGLAATVCGMRLT